MEFVLGLQENVLKILEILLDFDQKSARVPLLSSPETEADIVGFNNGRKRKKVFQGFKRIKPK